jgi:hypothetical protein
LGPERRKIATVANLREISGRRIQFTHPDGFFVEQDWLATGVMTAIREPDGRPPLHFLALSPSHVYRFPIRRTLPSAEGPGRSPRTFRPQRPRPMRSVIIRVRRRIRPWFDLFHSPVYTGRAGRAGVGALRRALLRSRPRPRGVRVGAPTWPPAPGPERDEPCSATMRSGGWSRRTCRAPSST